jgi:hypothetical protein
MSAIKFIKFQCAAALVAIGIWLRSGHSPFLFIAGIAVGAAIVAAVLEWEQRNSLDVAERRERIDA